MFHKCRLLNSRQIHWILRSLAKTFRTQRYRYKGLQMIIIFTLPFIFNLNLAISFWNIEQFYIKECIIPYCLWFYCMKSARLLKNSKISIIVFLTTFHYYHRKTILIQFTLKKVFEESLGNRMFLIYINDKAFRQHIFIDKSFTT